MSKSFPEQAFRTGSRGTELTVDRSPGLGGWPSLPSTLRGAACAGLVVLIGSFGLAQPSQAFELICALEDPISGTPRDTYFPGEDVTVFAAITLSEAELDMELSLKAAVFVEVAGFNLSVDLGKLNVTVPPLAEREMIDGFPDAEPHLPTEFTRDFSDTIGLPSSLPSGQATIKVTAQVGDMKKRTCKQTLTILD